MTAKHARHRDLIDKIDVTSGLNRHPDSAAKTATDYHDDQSRIVVSPNAGPVQAPTSRFFESDVPAGSTPIGLVLFIRRKFRERNG